MKQSLLILAAGVLLSACVQTQKVTYLQNQSIGEPQAIQQKSYITVQPQDMLSIIVSSKDPELALPFNLPRVQQIIGAQQQTGGSQQGQILGYTVDSKGNIDFPILGSLHIEGLSREEIANLIKKQLIDSDFIKDPVVTVDFLNLSFSVLGEVTRPGRFNIDKDYLTLLDALSMAGDLTIYGQRDKVYLVRDQNDERITYQLDLRSTDIYDSPAYYIQQNDIIYVEPNSVRAGQSTVNGNNTRSVSLWMSIASFLTTLGVIFFK